MFGAPRSSAPLGTPRPPLREPPPLSSSRRGTPAPPPNPRLPPNNHMGLFRRREQAPALQGIGVACRPSPVGEGGPLAVDEENPNPADHRLKRVVEGADPYSLSRRSHIECDAARHTSRVLRQQNISKFATAKYIVFLRRQPRAGVPPPPPARLPFQLYRLSVWTF